MCEHMHMGYNVILYVHDQKIQNNGCNHVYQLHETSLVREPSSVRAHLPMQKAGAPSLDW